MDAIALEAFAVELCLHSPTHWVATFYPMVATPAGRWADVTWVLHQALMPLAQRPVAAARWLEVSSPDPAHACYDHHPGWGAALAAGYATAYLVHASEATDTASGTLSPEAARQLRAAATVVRAGQLAEWLLDDLQDVDR